MKLKYILKKKKTREIKIFNLIFITGVGVLKVVGTELLVILIVVEWWFLSFDEFFKSLIPEVFFGSRGEEKSN